MARFILPASVLVVVLDIAFVIHRIRIIPTTSYGPGMSGLGHSLLALYGVLAVVALVVFEAVLLLARRFHWKKTMYVLFVFLLLINVWVLGIVIGEGVR